MTTLHCTVYARTSDMGSRACFHLIKARALALVLVSSIRANVFQHAVVLDNQNCTYVGCGRVCFLDYDVDTKTCLHHFTAAPDDTKLEREIDLKLRETARTRRFFSVFYYGFSGFRV